MALVFLGLICILFNFGFSYYSSAEGAMITLDLLPDFAGYLILCLAYEKIDKKSRWMRESQSIAVGMLVVSVLTFISQIRIVFDAFVDGIDSKVFALFAGLLTLGLNYVDLLIYAVTMVFMAFFSLAMMSEADKIRHRGWSVTYTVFFVLYLIFAAAFVVFQFVQLPFSAYFIAIPLNVAFAFVFYVSTKKLDVFDGR